ncbi:MAG: glycosyltransferase family 2 protein [Rhodospirillaceae bacterium]|nr:glycosyltransferase family 2 protein [Rhodospirillaceae bacterium]
MTAASSNPVPLISIVVPMFNEAKSLAELTARLDAVKASDPARFEFVFVDDGSADSTWDTITALAGDRADYKLLRLSRNFGKETALSAGIDAASGDAVIMMDCDLQHPPEVIAEFLAQWRQGHDVVYGVRRDRNNDSFLRASLSKMFYRAFNSMSDTRITPDAGDFRLMSRRVVDAIRLLRERSRFMKGIYAWVGYDGIGVPFDPPLRKHGKSSFSIIGLFKLATDGMLSFSTVPLKFGVLMGGVVAALALMLGLFYFTRTLVYGVDVPGYASIIVSVLALGGLILLQLGLVGLYVGRVLEEVKARPLYVVRDQHPQPAVPGAQVIHLDRATSQRAGTTSP